MDTAYVPNPGARRSMSIVTCPTEIIQAAAASVWRQLTVPAQLARWTNTRLVSGPGHPGELGAGDTLVLGAGVAGLFRVTFNVLDVQPPIKFGVDVCLPFGVVNHEVVVITPISASACRVTFN